MQELEESGTLPAVAAGAVRSILVDYLRSQHREKRGGDAVRVELLEVDAVFAPVMTTRQEHELTPVQWMEGMRNPETSGRFIAIGCI